MNDPFDGTEVTVVSEEMEGGYLLPKPPIKKKKYRGSNEQGDAARKPRSAYLLYYYDIYMKVQQEGPHLPQSEINKKISESWKVLSVAEKSYYLERAKLEKEGLDSNIKSNPSTMISDVPGFRKILPRSEYLLIPKSSADDDLCLTQTADPGAVVPSTMFSHNGCQNVYTLESREISLSDLADIDGEEGEGFTTTNTVQEAVPSSVFTHCARQMSDKLAGGEIVLNDAALEIGETGTYQSTSMVIEEDAGVALTRSDLSSGMSVFTVMAIQDTDENSPAALSSQYIMVPMPSRSFLEPPRSFQLASTYTRRGRGRCTNPACTFTYVTRHKPPKCPLCDKFLGGKWIPKGKQGKEKIATTNTTVQLSDIPNTLYQSTSPARESKATETENTEAVGHLLQTSPSAENEDWEEVVISEAHFLPSSDIAAEEMTAQAAEGDTSKTELMPSTGRSKVTSQVSNKANQSSTSSAQKAPETKCVTKPLAAAARPIRAILPAPANANQTISVECADSTLSLLKPELHGLITSTCLKASTLKQLGQTFLSHPLAQEITDLGLATQRGRGKCKTPFCNFMYTNRHKPKICPLCGFDLSKGKVEKKLKPAETPVCILTGVSVREHLTQSQKEIQRQSTLQLLRKSVKIPENECELSETFVLIQELNSSRLVLSDVRDGTVTIEQTSWASFYESPADQCLLCGTQLFKGDKNSTAGPQDCWLLTANRLQPVTARVKMCLNPQCLAIHSFNDINTGLFNVGNKLLVSIDLLFSIRNQIKMAEDPKVSINSMLLSVQGQIENLLSAEELQVVEELLSCGYWAFECLTVRDYNDMICGVCGVAPKVEIAQRNVENTLTLTNIEFTWPEILTSSEVNMEDFWSTLETEVLEQAAFPSSIPFTKFDASIISPFFPPLMRGSVVVNSESYKNLEIQRVTGNGSALTRLLHGGTLKLDDLNTFSKEELQRVLTLCGIPWNSSDTEDNMCYSILALSEFVQNGSQTKQPPSHLTGGKLYKVCPHQVVCGSKYIVRGESPRDHVDLLASSLHWPPVYVVDMATQVALCADLCYPQLTQQMWGKNQGCFSDPSESTKYVSCPELLDRHYSVDMTDNEPSIQHPVTKSASRRIVHAVAEQKRACDPTSRHHSLSLCRELEPYSAIITAIGDSKTSNIRHHPINFENATHYYLYNRLIDFLTSREIVNRQIHDIVQSCQPGEVVIRDTLYRLGVAQIKTEMEDSVMEEDILLEQSKCV